MKKGVVELTEDITVEKTITKTDAVYKIITAGARFHIGFGEGITLCFGEKEYKTKMHSSTKGRIDGLAQFYADAGLKIGDLIKLSYTCADKTVRCERIKQSDSDTRP